MCSILGIFDLRPDATGLRQLALRLSKLQRQMYDATVGLAKEKKFDIILGQGVVYSNDSVDITDQVLEKLKKEFKASGGK